MMQMGGDKVVHMSEVVVEKDHYTSSQVIVDSLPQCDSSLIEQSKKAFFDAPKSALYDITAHSYLNVFHGCEGEFENSAQYKNLTDAERGHLMVMCSSFQKKYDASEEIDKSKPHTFPDPYTLLRYLQADKWDPELGSNRLVSTIVWSQKIDLFALVAHPPPKLPIYLNARKRHYLGLSKADHPVFLERVGLFMASVGKGPCKQLTEEDYFHGYVITMGQFIEQHSLNKRRNPNASWKHLFIGDMKGVSVTAAYRAVGLIKSLSKHVEIHFPEMAAEPIFLINCPHIVAGAYKLIRPFLDPAIAAKIRISSSVPTKDLLQYIDKDVLFQELGGNAPNPE